MKKTKFKILKEVPKDLSQRAIKRLFPTRVNLRKSLAPTYYPIAHHIYYNGSAFRVRVMINGITFGGTTTDKKHALEFRDRLLLHPWTNKNNEKA